MNGRQTFGDGYFCVRFQGVGGAGASLTWSGGAVDEVRRVQ